MTSPSADYTFFARQPVFDAALKVWGHELLYRKGRDSTSADLTDIDAATLAVTAGVCQGQLRDVGQGKKIMVNFSEKTVLEHLPEALPPESTVVGILAVPQVSPELLTALGNLRREGYLIALDDFGAGGVRPDAGLLALAQVIVIPVQGRDPARLAVLVGKLRKPGRLLLAGRVEDQETFAKAREAGFDLFQGFFFHKPEIVPNRKLTSAEASRISLLRFIQQEDPEVRELAKAIMTDASISYRLLAYINSAFFGFREKVRDIERAVMLLGLRQIRNWLRVIILSDISHGEKADELAYASVQRGRFFELAAQRSGLGSGRVETLFMLGLFSLLEPMLGLPMSEIVETLPLDPGVESALLGEPGGLRPWLELAQAFESGDWTALDRLMRQLNLAPDVVAGGYAEAMNWTNSFFQGAK